MPVSMTNSRVVRSLAVLLFSAAGAFAAAAPPATPPPRFGEEIDVRLSTIILRVVDDWGAPVPGLGPRDFRVRLDGEEIPVVAVDWVATGNAPVEAPGSAPAPVSIAPPPAAALAPAPVAPGKLVVIFVQADNNSTVRLAGFLKMLPYVGKFLAGLDSQDRVAVVSFDSHLKLWQDFTLDREAVRRAVAAAVRFGGNPPTTAPTTAIDPSLARNFDAERAFHTYSPERALEATAEALKPLGGEKVMVFLGWGLGTFGMGGVRMAPHFGDAVVALAAARTSVFVLDVTEADSHDLEVGLEAVAEETGGSYSKTNVFPDLAVRGLLRSISGYYVLTLDPDRLPAGKVGGIEIDLREKRGTVLVRPVQVR